MCLLTGRDTCTLVADDWGGIVAWYMVLLQPHLFDCYVIMVSSCKDTCTLVAHDWGGIVAWYMVLLQPHLFDCYVIMVSSCKDTCTLVAHDWGGIVAWYMVLLHPHLFDCYVIMDSVHPVAYRKVLHRSLDQFRRSWYVFFFQLPYLPELVLRMDDFASFEKNIKSTKSPQPFTEEDLEAFKYTFGKPGALKHAIDYYRANFMLESVMKLSNHGTSEDFPPGLIMYGELDIYLSPEVHEVSVASVANAKLVCISGANHFVQQDDPESVNRELRKFFSEIPSKQQ
ncbi:Epoxide hydrolase 4 [Homalodisca vitripennis]|nr:Epoxide hydrolase 4 [Homalodisca vitripennis]